MDNNFNQFNDMEQTNEITAEAVEIESASENVKAKKPRKNHATLKVLSMILAVAIVGGGAGFGGAYFANKSIAANVNSVGTITDQNVISSANTHPTLDNLQSSISTLQHKVNETAEFNSDGTYKYTRDLVKAVQDTIVYIEVFQNYRGSSQLAGSASGIIISSDGYVVTNNHVVEDCDTYTVKVNNTDVETGEIESKTYDAKLLGTDEDTDLAVLKIDAQNLQAAVLGDSDKLSLGDDVVAIGNPFGLERSVSKGVVSGLRRQISDSARGLTSIQTDVAINSGNSGGGLFNGYGEIIGVVNEKYVNNYAESLGFAIDINDAKNVIDDLITKGYVSGRAILGITYENVTEYYAYRNGMIAGWHITDINQNLPIAKSDLKVGDTIVKIDGESVIGSDGATILAKKNPLDTITVTVARSDGFGRVRNVDIEVTLGESTGTN